ncbi:MAG: hypothetical protein ACK50A_13365 [Sphingobacteriaceae bacterium]
MKSLLKNTRFLIAFASIIICVVAIGIYASDSTNRTISVKNNVASDETAMSYSTSGEKEEVPHFNLFSIINKFIPH